MGWAWFAFNFQETNKFAVVDKGKGLGGGAAACAELKPNGGMTWACRCGGSCHSFMLHLQLISPKGIQPAIH